MTGSLRRYFSRISIENYIYIIFWIFIVVIPITLIDVEEDIKWERLLTNWIRFIPFFLLFLCNNFLLLPRFFYRGKRKLYSVGLILSFIATMYMFGWTKSINRQLMGNHTPVHKELFERPANDGNKGPIFRNIWNDLVHENQILFVVMIVVFNMLLKSYFIQQKKLKEHEESMKASLQLELDFLKQQISPHFFMNTLNNIHVLVDHNPVVAKESIISLSRLMRHLLYDTKNRLVPLRSEMSFIQNYIELMRMRFPEEIIIECNTPHEDYNKMVPPLLFISLIENAFKHGISICEQSYIRINFQFLNSDKFQCRIVNSNHAKTVDGHEGIGLRNTIKRLELEYHNNYTLDIDKTEKEYIVLITIPL